MNLRKDAEKIIEEAIKAALPDSAVKRALDELDFKDNKIHIVAIGKAAWQMCKAAYDVLGDRVTDGFVITKYEHAQGQLGNIKIYEAGHPVPDKNTYLATEEVIKAAETWGTGDSVLFLISGGGSALFEKPLIPESEMADITSQLLSSGAGIVDINIIRKRLSAVKGGRFARICAPAEVYSVILSDVLGDPVDMIASGPAYPDSSSCEDAMAVVKKFGLRLSDAAAKLLCEETPKVLNNVETRVTGSVSQLCKAAMHTCEELGYQPIFLTDMLSCNAVDAGEFMSAIARAHYRDGKNLAYIAGGETVVKAIGDGLGGRNQELALSAARGISGMDNVCLFSFGSDGTDGPTDAAGGFVDGLTEKILTEKGLTIGEVLARNDSYHALQKTDGLIITGPTGTNVNDLSVLLIKSHRSV